MRARPFFLTGTRHALATYLLSGGKLKFTLQSLEPRRNKGKIRDGLTIPTNGRSGQFTGGGVCVIITVSPWSTWTFPNTGHTKFLAGNVFLGGIFLGPPVSTDEAADDIENPK